MSLLDRLAGGRKRRWLLIYPAICVGLGVWQLYRLQWKSQLIDTIRQRLREPPAELRALPSTDTEMADWEHRRVRLRGRFLHDKEVLLGPRNKGGPGRPGFYVYTPFQLIATADPGAGQVPEADAGKSVIIMVNRGWIPQSHTSPSKRAAMHPGAQPAGIVTLTGMVRRERYYRPLHWRGLIPRSAFAGRLHAYTATTEDTASMQWLWLDLADMWRRLDLSLSVEPYAQIVSNYFVEEVLDMESAGTVADRQLMENMMTWHTQETETARQTSTLPSVLAAVTLSQLDPRLFQGKPILVPPDIHVPNKHLGYVYTWFSLAALLMVVLHLGGGRKPTARSSVMRTLRNWNVRV